MSMPTLSISSSPQDVLSFWFGTDTLVNRESMESVEYIESRMGVWFAGKSAEFDSVQKRAADLVDLVGEKTFIGAQWCTPNGILARVLLLDQFTRCIYRGTAKAFQYDLLTAELVSDAVRDGFMQLYSPIQRFFLGVAVQHAEDIVMQEIGVAIAHSVAEGSTAQLKQYFANIKGYPMEHRDVIAQFRRFPSRNAALVSAAVSVLCVHRIVSLLV